MVGSIALGCWALGTLGCAAEAGPTPGAVPGQGDPPGAFGPAAETKRLSTPASAPSEQAPARGAFPLGERTFVAPHGGDAPPRYALDPRALGDHPSPGPVLRALRFGDALLYVDPDFTLRQLGREAPLAERVHAAPAVSPDGARLAYVSLEGHAADTVAAVHVYDGARDRVIDRSLFNFGELRFSPDGGSLLGFGTVNGGVTGLHVVTLDGVHRCLTNCELRAGTPWGGRFVELPARIEDVPFDNGQWRVAAKPLTGQAAPGAVEDER